MFTPISIAIDQQLMPIHMHMVDTDVHHMLHLMLMDMVLVQVPMPIHMLMVDMVVVEFVKRVKYVIISDEQVCKCDK